MRVPPPDYQTLAPRVSRRPGATRFRPLRNRPGTRRRSSWTRPTLHRAMRTSAACRMASCVSLLGFLGICSQTTGATYSGRSARDFPGWATTCSTTFHRTTGRISGLCQTGLATWTPCSTAQRKSASPTSTAGTATLRRARCCSETCSICLSTSSPTICRRGHIRWSIARPTAFRTDRTGCTACICI
jgi:hypothetical protein